jgi:hypothetical protein
VPGLRVNIPPCSDHLGSEHDVAGGDHLEQQFNPRVVINAGVEIKIL